MSKQILSHQYLFEIPPALVAMWSARAIYTVKPEPFVDILSDRQHMHGEDEGKEAKHLCKWLNGEGTKGLQAKCKANDVCPNEACVVEFSGKEFVIKGNPNASHGYLYIVAYRLPSEPA